MAEPGSPPDVSTIEEAARVLRMGRTAAYEQARIWRDTDGRAGLPNFRMGDTLRVPAAALEKMLGRPLSAIPEPRRRDHPDREQRPRPASRRRPTPGGAQGALPL